MRVARARGSRLAMLTAYVLRARKCRPTSNMPLSPTPITTATLFPYAQVSTTSKPSTTCKHFPGLPESLLPTAGLDVCRCTVACGGCVFGRKDLEERKPAPQQAPIPSPSLSVLLRGDTAARRDTRSFFLDSWLPYFITLYSLLLAHQCD